MTNMTQTFTKAANQIVGLITRARGFEISKDPAGQPMIKLLDTGHRHKVSRSGKVATTPNIMARLGINDIVKATQDVALPKIQMMVRMMCAQTQTPQLAPIHVHAKPQQPTRPQHRTDF